jgi:hypothetical protein
MKSEGYGKFLFLATPCEASLNPGRAVVGRWPPRPGPTKEQRPLHLDSPSPPIPALHRDESSGCVAPGRRRDSTQPRQLTTGLSSVWPCAAQPVNHQASCGFFPLCNELDAESPAQAEDAEPRGSLILQPKEITVNKDGPSKPDRDHFNQLPPLSSPLTAVHVLGGTVSSIEPRYLALHPHGDLTHHSSRAGDPIVDCATPPVGHFSACCPLPLPTARPTARRHNGARSDAGHQRRQQTIQQHSIDSEAMGSGTTQVPQVEARSLSDLNILAANPPQYPHHPEVRESLTLYISRVPGTRGVYPILAAALCATPGSLGSDWTLTVGQMSSSPPSGPKKRT